MEVHRRISLLYLSELGAKPPLRTIIENRWVFANRSMHAAELPSCNRIANARFLLYKK